MFRLTIVAVFVDVQERFCASLEFAGSVSASLRLKVKFPASQNRAGKYLKLVIEEGETDMSMSDPIADLLTRIRNAIMAKHDDLSMPSSKIKAEIAALLSQEGYIGGFKILRDNKQGILKIKLKYKNGVSAVSGLKRISKPGLRVYTGADDIPSVRNGLGAAIISTNMGILTDAEAKEAKVGGEVLCHVW